MYFRPNATNVRIAAQWDFAVDLIEVLNKIKILCDYLAELPPNGSPKIMVQFNDKVKAPKSFDFFTFKPINEKLKAIPIAKFPTQSASIA